MKSADVNGIEIAYEVLGEGGEPLLLIMGLGAQMVAWPDGFCERLVSQGFHVIRFDNRDVGRSTWLDHLGVPDVKRAIARRLAGQSVDAPYTLQDMADDAAGLLDHLNIPAAHVAGVSMGGMIAQTLTIGAPDRVRTLTSIMSNIGARRHMVVRPRAAAALLVAPRYDTREAYIEDTVKFFETVGGKLPMDPAVLREMSGVAFDRGHNPQAGARHLAAVFASPNRGKALRDVVTPSLVVHGLSDPLVVPAGGKATAAALMNAKFLGIPGMGHSLPRAVWDPIVSHMRVLADENS